MRHYREINRLGYDMFRNCQFLPKLHPYCQSPGSATEQCRIPHMLDSIYTFNAVTNIRTWL